MSEPLPDTWHSRELPVLREIVRQYDDTLETIRVEDLEKALPDLTADDVQRACVALESDHLIETRGAMGRHVLRVGKPASEARRLTGAWPSADSVADKLLAALQDLAEYGDDEVTRSRARKALDALGSFGRDTLVSVAGAAAGVAMTQ